MLTDFIFKQINDIKKGGLRKIFHKSVLGLKLLSKVSIFIPFYILGIFFVLIIRLIEPLILIRIGYLVSSRIGHFAGNTELYFCEKDAGINVPSRKYIDIFFHRYHPISNIFLEEKISSILIIYPQLFLEPIFKLNKLIPGFEKFEVGQNSQHDRDINNLLDNSKIHINFTKSESYFGDEILEILGIPKSSKIVCLLVRDSSYLFQKFGFGYEYHNFRDSNIHNYLNAAEELAKIGYYVVRMGEIVLDKFISQNDRIIDYANSKYKSPFLDIYLGHKCEFAISTSSGWDAVPSHLFKKPILYTNYVPIGLFSTFSHKYLLTTKKYFDISSKKILGFNEIFTRNLHFLVRDEDYQKNNLILIENTPDEIKDAAIDMHLMINNKLLLNNEDQVLQMKFWESYPKDLLAPYYRKNPLHGNLKALMSPSFLRNNKSLIV